MKLLTGFCVFLCAFTASAMPDHSLFTAILTEHVHEGRVDYDTLQNDDRLPRYLAQLARTAPAELADDKSRFAFWLNAYNAYTLQLILEHRPTESITQIGKGGLILGQILNTTAWDIRFAEIGGKKYTLNEIEHEIIRQKFKDSRAHFALNCASGSCPVLRTEAYTSGQLDAQLDDQAREFLADSSRNRFDLETRTAWISAIFKWYQKDFGQDKHAALLAAAKYAPDDVRRAIEADPHSWKIKFLPYDWSLNNSEAPPGNHEFTHFGPPPQGPPGMRSENPARRHRGARPCRADLPTDGRKTDPSHPVWLDDPDSLCSRRTD